MTAIGPKLTRWSATTAAVFGGKAHIAMGSCRDLSSHSNSLLVRPSSVTTWHDPQCSVATSTALPTERGHNALTPPLRSSEMPDGARQSSLIRPQELAQNLANMQIVCATAESQRREMRRNVPSPEHRRHKCCNVMPRLNIGRTYNHGKQSGV